MHPQPEQESIFRTVFAWWLRFGGIFRRSLRGRRLKKGHQLFWEKVHPRQNSGYACDLGALRGGEKSGKGREGVRRKRRKRTGENTSLPKNKFLVAAFRRRSAWASASCSGELWARYRLYQYTDRLTELMELDRLWPGETWTQYVTGAVWLLTPIARATAAAAASTTNCSPERRPPCLVDCM